MTNNFCRLEGDLAAYDTSKVVILPVPYDKTRTWIVGRKWLGVDTSKGPQGIIDASKNMEIYDIDLQKTPAEIGIHTLPPIKIDKDPESVIQSIKAEVAKHLSHDKFVVMLGGEHSISYGYYLALQEKYNDISVLQLDAHTDLRDSLGGTKYSHGSVMARMRESSKQVVQVGIRAVSEEESVTIQKNKYDIFYAHEIYNNNQWFDKAISKLGKNVFVTVDLDCLDTSIIPSTGTPEPGGLLWYQVIDFLKKVFKERNIIGFDVVEHAPNEYSTAADFTAAKLVYKLIGFKFFL
jgi:agmatinase